MTGPNLIYVADPMCSWCWGFSPVIDAISQRFGEDLPIRLVLGGLRPGTAKPLDEAGKSSIREHWEHVQEASGQPFDMHFFDREDFIYDTEPACKGVVVVRQSGMDRALSYLRAVHHAFYAENRDVTEAEVLADLAEQAGLDREGFLKRFGSEEVRQETWTDFAIAQRAGITGFPTLLAGVGEGSEYALVTQGFQSPGRILPLLEQWFAAVTALAEDDPAGNESK